MEKATFDPPFPTDALMPTLGGAAHFIHQTNQSPIEMCACSVLAAATLSCQGLFDVRWKDHGQSPSSLYIFVEAESGERKTSNDDIAFSEIRKFTGEQTALAQKENTTYETARSLWKEKINAINKLIARRFAKCDSTEEQEAMLMALISQEPQKHKYAQLQMLNLTPEALSQHLGHKYPYAGLICDEGAAVFVGGALRDPGMLNKLWEAGTWSSERIKRGYTDLSHARLTIYIQTQPTILDLLLKRQGAQLDGSGFFSRCLFVRAKSQQGKRLRRYVDIPKSEIEIYDARIRELLNRHAKSLPPQPTALTLSKNASDLLSQFSRDIETQLGDGGRFEMMRGAASKAAENSVRLAAVLHTVENLPGPISADTLRNGIKLSAWFLNQYRMRFCPRSQSELDMIELEEFIANKVVSRFEKEKSVPGPYLCRVVPKHLRPVDRLWEVLKNLEIRGKVKLWGQKGSSWSVQLLAWFPLQVQQPRSVASLDESGRWSSSHWRGPRTSPVTPEHTETRPLGHELWPEVYLE